MHLLCLAKVGYLQEGKGGTGQSQPWLSPSVEFLLVFISDRSIRGPYAFDSYLLLYPFLLLFPTEGVTGQIKSLSSRVHHLLLFLYILAMALQTVTLSNTAQIFHLEYGDCVLLGP